jgi:hypothetical protein
VPNKRPESLCQFQLTQSKATRAFAAITSVEAITIAAVLLSCCHTHRRAAVPCAPPPNPIKPVTIQDHDLASAASPLSITSCSARAPTSCLQPTQPASLPSPSRQDVTLNHTGPGQEKKKGGEAKKKKEERAAGKREKKRNQKEKRMGQRPGQREEGTKETKNEEERRIKKEN